jgi:hypothetical protein
MFHKSLASTAKLGTRLQQSAGVMEHFKISNPKHQISGFQVSGKKNKKTET